MSSPSYLENIVNSQSKNKEIASIQKQIKQFLPSSVSNKNINGQGHVQQRRNKIFVTRKQSIKKPFFKDFQPRKTFSQMHIAKLVNKIPQSTNTKIVQKQPQIKHFDQYNQEVKQWKDIMKRHLLAQKQSQKDTKNAKESKSIATQKQKQGHQYAQIDVKRETVREVVTASKGQSLYINKRQTKTNNFQNIPDCINNKMRCTLRIRQNFNKKTHLLNSPNQRISDKPFSSKLYKNFSLRKFNNQRNISQKDELFLQRLQYFHALLPYLQAHKANMKKRQQRKGSLMQNFEAKLMGIKLRSKPEDVINISPWQSPEEVYE